MDAFDVQFEPWHLPHMDNQPNDGGVMKPSHERTPRTLNDCHFQPGYMSAPDRSPAWTDAAITVVGVLILVTVLPLIYLGVL